MPVHNWSSRNTHMFAQVRAEVLSLGDSRSYYLSTAKDEYGVVHAKGPAGEALVPLSWQDMQVRTRNWAERESELSCLKVSGRVALRTLFVLST